MTTFYVLNESGVPVPAPDGMVLNDLTRSKVFDELPEGALYIPIVIQGDGGRPWIALVKPSVLLTRDEVNKTILSKVEEARRGLVEANDDMNERQNGMIDSLTAVSQQMQKTEGDLTAQGKTLTSQAKTLTEQSTALTAAQASLTSQQATMQTLLEQIQARKVPIALPDISIPASALIAATAGPKTIANLTCTGIKTTDTIAINPKSMSSGYGFLGYTIPANDKITITLQCPILSVGGVAQTLGATAFR